MATIARRIGSTSRPPHSGRRLGAGWVAVLLAMLVVFSWQSFFAETHNHFARAQISTNAGPTGAVAKSSSDQNSPYDSPANCPICREIAQSAAYLPPTPIVLPAPEALLVWLVAGLTFGLILERRSLGWHSRAPPTPLQA
ncbi:DUF2946 family protein [Sphingomonas pruni]|uniref:DUF2946 family protein n=1 Tax=Sphingomonas pruni TaxID=40683 RepID=UPI00082CEE15|nr:DUF2946 family protein [Sphingomonas pruni]